MVNAKTNRFLFLVVLSSCSILPIGCIKETNTGNENFRSGENGTSSQIKEIPIDKFKSNKIAFQSQMNANYGCGSNLSGSYGGSGYYMYSAYTLDLTSTSFAANVTITVVSNDVPNRFNIYDGNSQLVATTSWMGYANYPGPWGMSLSTPQTRNMVFSKKNTTYTLKVETSTRATSDSWSASVSCQSGVSVESLSNQQIIDIYSNVGAPHNEGLDKVLLGLQSYYGSVYHGGNSLAAHDLMYKKIDSLTKIYLTTQRSVSQTDANNCINNFKNMPKSPGSDLTVNISSSPYYNSLSTQFRAAVSQLNTVFQDNAKCYTKSYYDGVVNANIALLPSNNEKMYIVAMCSVGYNSSIYWRDNYSKWQTFFGSGISTWGKKVASADVSGIVKGAIGGCAVGAAGGTVTLPVVGTVAGCAGVGVVSAVGGGLIGSATSAIDSFFDWVFGT